MDAFEILVVILSVALAVLLLMAIVFMYFAVKTVRAFNSVADKAQDVVDNVETASRIFQKSAGPVAFTRVLSNVVDIFKEQDKKKSKGKK